MANATRSQSTPLVGDPADDNLTPNQATNMLYQNCDNVQQVCQKSKVVTDPEPEVTASPLAKSEADVFENLNDEIGSFANHEAPIGNQLDRADGEQSVWFAKLIQIFQMFFQVLVDLRNRIQTTEQNANFLPEIQSILSDFFNSTQNSMQNSFDARLDEFSREIFSRIECLSVEVRAKHSYVCDELQSVKDLAHTVLEKQRAIIERYDNANCVSATGGFENLQTHLAPESRRGPPPYPGDSTFNNIPEWNSQFTAVSGNPEQKVGGPPAETSRSDEARVSPRELLDVVKLMVKGKPSPSVPLKDMPTFDGSDSSKLVKFFDEFERCQNFCGWDDETSIQKLRDSCLTGHAKAVIRDHPRVNNFVRFRDFKIFLKEQFFANSDKKSAITQFLELKQRSDQCLTDFHQTLCELATIGLENDATREHILVHTFVKNLHDGYVRDAVERKGPLTMSQALVMAKEEEGIQLRRRERWLSERKHNPPQNSNQNNTQGGRNPNSPTGQQGQNSGQGNSRDGGNRGSQGNWGLNTNRFQGNSPPPNNSPPNPSSQSNIAPNLNSQAPQSGGSTRPGGA